MSTSLDRAQGALYGLAIGDALGMPTQLMSHEEVAACFGALDGFRQPPADHVIAAGLPVGSITDDTEQALLVADALLARGGHIDSEDLARRLLSWAERVRERGSWICWVHPAVPQWQRWWQEVRWTRSDASERPMGRRCGSLLLD